MPLDVGVRGYYGEWDNAGHSLAYASLQGEGALSGCGKNSHLQGPSRLAGKS